MNWPEALRPSAVRIWCPWQQAAGRRPPVCSAASRTGKKLKRRRVPDGQKRLNVNDCGPFWFRRLSGDSPTSAAPCELYIHTPFFTGRQKSPYFGGEGSVGRLNTRHKMCEILVRRYENIHVECESINEEHNTKGACRANTTNNSSTALRGGSTPHRNGCNTGRQCSPRHPLGVG